MSDLTEIDLPVIKYRRRLQNTSYNQTSEIQ